MRSVLPRAAALAVGLVPAALALQSTPAHAEDGELKKRLSLTFTSGIRPDMAQLGGTITQDGTVGTADSTIANALYATSNAFMSDRDNLTIWDGSNTTEADFRLMGQEPTVGGAMLGIELGARARYELDDVVNFPMYVSLGFHHTSKMSGGEQSRMLGDVGTTNQTVNTLFLLNGLDPADYDGGVMTNEYDASWTEIPLSVGIKVKAKKKPFTFAYGQFGVSQFAGGFSVSMNMDQNYVNALASHWDSDTNQVVNYANHEDDEGNQYTIGPIDDTVEFKLSGMGLNYGLGVQAGTKAGIAFFAELNSSGTSQVVYGSNMKDDTRKLLTATSSDVLPRADENWFNRLAFPVVTTGASFRTGVTYYFF